MASHAGALNPANPARRGNLARLALQADGVFCVALGAALAAGAAPVAEFSGLPVAAVLAVGIGTIPYGAWLFLRSRRHHDRRMLLTIASLNVAWVVASALLLLAGPSGLTVGGGWAVGIVALLVADLAAAQFYAARRAR